jgi:hypothetical protein
MIAPSFEGREMSKRPPLHLEELGDRVLPSATPVPPAAPVPTATVFDARLPVVHHALAGHGQGTYTKELVPVDAGGFFRLDGMANLAALGQVNVTGWVSSVGFVHTGRAAGQLTFSNSHGSVTVRLLGNVQPGFSPLPRWFAYNVTGGTGAYAHLSDHGELKLVLQVSPTAALPHIHGTFKLTI